MSNFKTLVEKYFIVSYRLDTSCLANAVPLQVHRQLIVYFFLKRKEKSIGSFMGGPYSGKKWWTCFSVGPVTKQPILSNVFDLVLLDP